MAIRPIEAERLCLKTNALRLPFETTAGLPPPEVAAGQARALQALDYGVLVARSGSGIFVAGRPGLGKRMIVTARLARLAAAMSPPRDWVYAHNFSSPTQPRAFSFGAGEGARFQAALADFVNALRQAMPRLFESERYMRLVAATQERTRASFGTSKKAAKRSTRLLDQLLGEDQIRSLCAPLIARYGNNPQIREWLEALRNDAVAHVDDLQAAARGEKVEIPFARYAVALACSQRSTPVTTLAPEDAQNLFGRFADGDASSFQPGPLNRANGGFLLADAALLASDPVLRRNLEQAIRQGAIGHRHDNGLQPQSIPLDVKLIAFGDIADYAQLCRADRGFAGLFKVWVEFADSVPRDDQHAVSLMRAVADASRNALLRPLDRGAAARLIDEAARMSGHSERLSLRIGALTDIARQANHYAAQAGRTTISSSDIGRAILMRRQFSSHWGPNIDAFWNRVATLAIEGERVGELNALPANPPAAARVSAQVWPGNGRTIEVERLGQRGVAGAGGARVVSGYLAGRFSASGVSSLYAATTVEGGIAAETTSAAELIAVLSAIADVPLAQGIAVAGGVDIYGRLLPVERVNEVIESYFELCVARGITGRAGVIVPAANAGNLMLRDSVVDAARDGRFAVYAVDNVDRALEILTDMEAGAARKGSYPKGSLNRRIADRLTFFARPRKLRPVQADSWWRI